MHVPNVLQGAGARGAGHDELFVVVPIVAVSAAVMSPLLVPLARWSLRLRRPEWTQPVKEPAE